MVYFELGNPLDQVLSAASDCIRIVDVRTRAIRLGKGFGIVDDLVSALNGELL
jgi:hypothetical protein